MATKTSSGSGLWSAVMGSPANGDTCIIAEGHQVTFDVDISAFTNGLALLTISAGAILDFKASAVTYLKMNGNIDVNGAFYIGERATVSSFSATEDRTNVYQASRTVKTYSVEETLGNGFLAAWNEVMEAAIEAENARLRAIIDEQGNPGREMMPDEVITFIETTRTSLTLSDYLDYLEDNPGSFYHDTANNILYIHCSDSSNPSTKTITGIEPINRPTAGTENRCQIIFAAAGQTFTNTQATNQIVKGFGWHPERIFTKITANAALNATEITLENSLDLQQGSKIAIASGNEYGATAEATKGVYTVQSYNSETKTVTLTSGLQTARLAGDYVCLASATIKISRTSGTTAFFSSRYPATLELVGVNNNLWLLSTISSYFQTFSSLPGPYFLRYCVASVRGFFFGARESEIEYCCTVGGSGYSIAENINGGNIKNSIAIGEAAIYDSVGATVENIVVQNAAQWGSSCRSVKNSIFKNINMLRVGEGSNKFINSVFHARNYLYNPTEGLFIGCTFLNNCFNSIFGKFYNCIFPEPLTKDVLDNSQEWQIESFNHQQIKGNYYALMNGGSIETLFTNEVVQPGHLIFKPVSAIYPVYRDYPITVREGRIHQYRVGMKKDFSGGIVKAEIIDPSADPLVDTAALALKTVNMPDIADDKRTISISYKATQNKQLILRVSVINSSGNVYIDPPFDRFRKYQIV